jgi:NADPH-dependent 2,4-dienoyl-CoA reductase/sulfur reductase-like enzyme
VGEASGTETQGRVAPFGRPIRRVAVVGAGLAGLRACENLRELGFEGEIALLGGESHMPYDRPPLSKQFLAGSWDLERISLRSAERIAGLGLDLRLGQTVESLDLGQRVLRLAGGGEVAFDGLVLATGAVPRHLRGSPEGVEGLYVLRTLDDCLSLREALGRRGVRVAVVGAGFIGSEVASTAASRGAEVTVIESMAVPLVRALGEEMGRACASLHADAGVRLLTGVGVEGVATSGSPGDGGRSVTGVALSDGSVVPAEVVVVGIGVRPATDWLEGSGLALADGVVCDETLHAAPGVVAAGDVCRWRDPSGAELRVEHWENAAEQGRQAAESLLADSAAAAYDAVPYFWSDQYGIKIQVVGHSQPADEVKVVEGSVDERRFVACYGRQGRLVAVLAFHRPRLLVRYRELLVGGASFEEALRFDPS